MSNGIIQPPVTEPEALSRWEAFTGDLRKRLSALPPGDRYEILLELSAHVADAYQSQGTAAAQAERLGRAIGSLGDPDEFLHLWAEEYRVENRARRGNPAALLRLLALRFGRSAALSAAVIIAGLGLAVCLLVFALGIYAFFTPDAGLWIHDQGSWTLSFEAQAGATQWKPSLFPLAAVLSSAIGYALIVVGIRRAPVDR